jgi:hypothetical protein
VAEAQGIPSSIELYSGSNTTMVMVIWHFTKVLRHSDPPLDWTAGKGSSHLREEGV